MRETPGSIIFAGSCTVVQSVRDFTTTAYASRRTTVCATKRAVDGDGACKQAYNRVQRNGRSTTTAYASRRTTVCNVTGGRQQRRMRAGVRACVRRIGQSTTTS